MTPRASVTVSWVLRAWAAGLALAPCAAVAAGGPAESGANEPSLTAARVIERVRNGPESRRRYWGHVLGRLGPEAVAATRAARDEAPSDELRRTFQKAVTWQVAAKLVPALVEGFESQLTFAGQYAGLLDEGADGVRALLALVADAATDLEVRFAACRALADAVDPSLERPEGVEELSPELRADVLGRLRSLYHDILIPASLREQIGLLLAVLGDTQAVDASIRRLLRFAASENRLESLQSHILLANLYYRIRDYEKALASYEVICGFYEELLEAQKKQGGASRAVEAISTELALHYYNTACSASLNRDVGKAKSFLEKAVRLSPIHAENVEKDGDLANVRRSEGYPAFLERLRTMGDPSRSSSM